MSAVPDCAYLLALAERIGAHADATRSDAGRLLAAVTGTHWRGSAADSFHLHTYALVGVLRACADRLDDSAAALRVHAGNVARVVAGVH